MTPHELILFSFFFKTEGSTLPTMGKIRELGSEVAGFVAADNSPDKISEDQRPADNLPTLHLYRYIINK